jgi:hypothetical protein
LKYELIVPVLFAGAMLEGNSWSELRAAEVVVAKEFTMLFVAFVAVSAKLLADSTAVLNPFEKDWAIVAVPLFFPKLNASIVQLYCKI